MSRLIDADALLDSIKIQMFDEDYDITSVISDIENAPTIDAVPVVRCVDCGRWNTILDRTNAEYGLCQIRSQLEATKNDDFCSRGERRTDELGITN